MEGHIYLVQEREFIRLKEPTYKIGRTAKDPNSRLVNYPKKSKVLLVISVDDCKKSEKVLIKIFDIKFKKMKEYGNEYYQGSLGDMIKTIYEHVYTTKYLPAKTIDDYEKVDGTYVEKVPAKSFTHRISDLIKSFHKLYTNK